MEFFTQVFLETRLESLTSAYTPNDKEASRHCQSSP